MYICKIHKTQGEVVVAACDKELVGKRLSDGDLEVHISERFYGGDLMSAQEIIAALEDASISNIFGNRLVSELVAQELVDPVNVLEFGGVKHTQIVLA